MGNSHKKGWSHVKDDINGWDISFTKISRICQWTGKNIFHCGKWNEPIGNSAHTTKYLAKRSWRHLFLAYVYKSIALVNELLKSFKSFSIFTIFLIFLELYWYHSYFSQDFVDNSHFGLKIYELLNKNLKQLLRNTVVGNWYQNLDYQLIRECVRLKINISPNLVAAKRLWGHSESIFTWNL